MTFVANSLAMLVGLPVVGTRQCGRSRGAGEVAVTARVRSQTVDPGPAVSIIAAEFLAASGLWSHPRDNPVVPSPWQAPMLVELAGHESCTPSGVGGSNA